MRRFIQTETKHYAPNDKFLSGGFGLVSGAAIAESVSTMGRSRNSTSKSALFNCLYQRGEKALVSVFEIQIEVLTRNDV